MIICPEISIAECCVFLSLSLPPHPLPVQAVGAAHHNFEITTIAVLDDHEQKKNYTFMQYVQNSVSDAKG
jgi:hypothetical protein